MRPVLRVLVPSVLVVFSVAGCGAAQNDPPATAPTSADAPVDIVATADGAGSFKTLVAEIGRAHV